ncbi:MAG: hypothetical protein K0R57_4848 [Paenibacillaceae bacterium]|jgi:signal transduction histidine kinase/DNA-binding response OmpR family regulator|nr:hypothetical protein [Paenibacillaceae bacterium]
MNLPRKHGLAASLSIWITAIISVSTLVLVAIGLLFNIQNKNIGDDMELQLNEVLHVQEAHRNSQSIVSSYRGFIAYGRNEFADNALHEIEDLVVKLGQIHSTMVQSSLEERRQADTIADIQASWRELSGLMQTGVEYRKNGNVPAVESLSESRVTPLIDGINTRFEDLMRLQEQNMQRLLADNKMWGNWLLGIPFTIIVLSSAMGYYLVRYMRRSVITPVLYMSKTVSRIAGGDYVEVEGTERKDELGTLQQGIQLMSEKLRKWVTELESFNKELINQRDLLEVQNEEITAQQEEQQETLLKLTARERELELLTSYQEKLAGHLDLQEFMEAAMPALLQVLAVDAAAIVLKKEGAEETAELVYSAGYPRSRQNDRVVSLFGLAERIFIEKKVLVKSRQLSEAEKGAHGLYERALDQYIPLLGNNQTVFGFLLLTSYGGDNLTEDSVRPKRGLVNQFSVAMHAQVLNAERLNQSVLLGRLHEELLKEKQYIQEQRDFYTKVNESIYEGMLIASPDGRIQYANRRMDSYFGYKPAPGDTLDDFSRHLNKFTNGGSLFLGDTIRKLATEDKLNYHERFRAEGEQGTRHYELYMNTMVASDLVGKSYLFVFRDRTDEEKADEIKNEFVSIVSHELRTPLSSVLGFIEILLNRQVTPEKQQRYLETIHSEAGRLSTLINDFLDLQRMEAGKQVYQPVPCEISGLVQRVMEQWEGKNQHAIRLHTGEAPLMALADADRITQVLHNLVSNAIKYSPKSDVIDIICSYENNFIRIDVQDYGLGIPEDAKAKLFSKFYRVDNTDRRQIGGTGLGLAIVKEIVEAHNGRLSFVSELGQGSTFSIWLPVYEAKDLSGKVVIIEDDENLAKLLTVSFERLQVPTLWISSAEDAVYSMNVSAASPIICIVDIQLKGVQSGWDFISTLLKHPLHRETPIIVTTVLEQPNHFYETTKEKYLQKPFSIERLLELVKHLVSGSQNRAPFVFPVQDKQLITDSLQHKGFTVKEIKVRSDFIEVNIEKDDDIRD